jgi:hypothetical protein
MIALHYGLSLVAVDDLPITDYRLMLWTIFNSAALNGFGGEFKMQTPDEELEAFDDEIEMYKKMGLLQ